MDPIRRAANPQPSPTASADQTLAPSRLHSQELCDVTSAQADRPLNGAAGTSQDVARFGEAVKVFAEQLPTAPTDDLRSVLMLFETVCAKRERFWKDKHVFGRAEHFEQAALGIARARAKLGEAALAESTLEWFGSRLKVRLAGCDDEGNSRPLGGQHFSPVSP